MAMKETESMSSGWFRRRGILTFLALMGSAAAVLFAAGETKEDRTAAKPPTFQARRPAGASGTVVVPDSFLRRWDPITVFFAGDTGPSAGGPEDHPERLITLSPLHPGAYIWIDSRTLQFRPSQPWPPLARFQLKVPGASVTLNTLMVPPSQTLPAGGAEGLDPVGSLTLTFPEPLDLEALARMISIEERDLPGVDAASAHWLNASDFQIKALERGSTSDPASYVLVPDHPVPLGKRAIVHLRLSPEEVPASFWDFSFSTAEPFRILGIGGRTQRYPVTPEGTRYTKEQALGLGAGEKALTLEFSAAPRELGPIEGRNLVRFSPSVGDLSYHVTGKLLEISGNFVPETVYRVTVTPTPISDEKGRPLTLRGESEIYFYLPSQPPYLRWETGQGIVERFGPQMLPVEGRADAAVDLRIHRIDPLDRSFWPFDRHPLSVDESIRPPGPGEEPQAYDDRNNPIPSQEVAARIAALGSPAVSKIVNLPLQTKGSAASFGLDLEPHLKFISGKGSAGTYLVGIRRLGGAGSREWMRIQVTDLCLTTLEEPRKVRFLVTSLSTGKPVTGARVVVEGILPPGSLAARATGSVAKVDSGQWGTLKEGTTGTDGSLVWDLPARAPDRPPAVRRIVVRTGDDSLVLDPRRAPDGFADNHWFPTRETWLQWSQHPLGARGAQPEILCHMFTERPVYRPEETVHIKGYLRRREAGALAVIPMQAFVVVEGPGDLKWRYPVTLTDAGSFYHPFAAEKLPPGEYRAHLEDQQEKAYGSVTFKMEAYRIPQFEVHLHAPDRVPLDQEFEVKLTAAYYAGGRVSGQPLQWRVTQFPYAWTPKKRPGFLYSSDSRFSAAGRFQSTPRLEKQETTDDEGGASLALNPAVEPTAQPRTYVVEATVTGADDQTVTSVSRIAALPPFVLGLKVPRFIERATSVKPEVIVLGPDDEPRPGTSVTVRLLNRQWHSYLRASDFSTGEARYITDIVDEKVTETTIQSGRDPVVVPLPIARSGVYVVEIEGHDRLGRAQVVSADFYAGGDEPLAWSKPSTRVFSVVADKDAYDPGESAALVLESPFQRGSVLAIVEAPEGNEYQWLAVENGAVTFRLLVRGTFAPRVPVHFVLMRGRVPGTKPVPGSATDLGKPATLAATTWVKVNAVDNRVNVTLQLPEVARPGQKIDVTIHLKDPKGKPLPGEVALWLVDQAVLSLGTEQHLDPLPDFLTEVRSYLVLRDTRNLAFGLLPFAEKPGGEVGGVLGGVPGGLPARSTVRRNFKTVPYYNPAITVGPDGTATVPVTLSDDLTNFMVRAKAASGADRFGYGGGMVSVRLPVIVQPALPRFVRPGDRFTGAAIGRIVEGEGGPGSAEVQLEGVNLEGPSRRDLTWTRERPERIEFQVVVPTPETSPDGTIVLGKAKFRVGVARAADGASDAFEVKIPVRDDRPRVTTRLMRELEPGKAVALPEIAEKARPGTVRRTVLVSSQPGLIKMAAGLDFLMRYPYGCTEQRLSLARAGIATRKLRALLHQEGDEKELDRSVQDTLAWIPSVLDAEGRCAFWPGGPGHISLTAWVLQFLVEAKEAGYPVDAKLVDTLTRSLQKGLRSDYGDFIDGESYAERTWALIALAAAGKLDPSYAAELARKSQFLDLEGVAQVAQTLALSGEKVSTSPALQALARKLQSGVVTRLYHGHETYGGLQEGRVRSGLILPSETRTLAEVTRAVARIEAESPRLPILTEALVTLGHDDGWGDTQADASAILALSELLKPPFQAAPRRKATVRAGNDSVTLATGPDSPVGYWSSSSPLSGQVTLEPGEGKGPFILRAETSYIPLADGSEVASHSQGFVVSRELSRLGKEAEPPEKIVIASAGALLSFSVGDVAEEHVQVVNPKDRHYVAVVVPLAAGMEPLNPRLATAPPEATPSRVLTRSPTYVAYLDDQVAYYYDLLPKGTYDFYFRTRATVAGRFTQPAARAEMMYDLSVEGNSSGARVEITRKPE
jgi:uncharacterized protein YfaS (alpha-2-macroglobulin family)